MNDLGLRFSMFGRSALPQTRFSSSERLWPGKTQLKTSATPPDLTNTTRIKNVPNEGRVRQEGFIDYYSQRIHQTNKTYREAIHGNIPECHKWTKGRRATFEADLDAPFEFFWAIRKELDQDPGRKGVRMTRN